MLKWSAKHPLKFSILYFAFYLIYFFALERLITEPIWIVSSPMDAYIPFTKYALIPYAMWFPWIAITILGQYRYAPKKEYLQTCYTMYIGMTLCLLFYTIVPNGLHVRPTTVEGNDILATIVRALWSFDSPMNVCPSLHVYMSVCMDLSWNRSSLLQKKPGIKLLLHLLDLSICASTVLLKQHSIIDVFAGIVLAYLLDALVSNNFSQHESQIKD